MEALHKLAARKEGLLEVNTACCRWRRTEYGVRFLLAVHLGSEGHMH